MTYVDVLVLLAVVPLVAVFAVSCSRSMDSASNRVNCAKNLRQIGQAMLLYANENRGNCPRATYDPIAADSSAPVWGTGTAAPDLFGPGGPNKNDVTAGLFLLLRTQQITPATFVCPS